MRKRGEMLTAILCEADAAGAAGAERETLIQAGIATGVSEEQARRSVSHALHRKLLARVIDDEGHTRYTLGPMATRQAPAARRRPAQTRPAVERTKGSGKVDVIHRQAADEDFRCGVMDNGELILIVGDEPTALSAVRTRRIWNVLRRHFENAGDAHRLGG